MLLCSSQDLTTYTIPARLGLGLARGKVFWFKSWLAVYVLECFRSDPERKCGLNVHEICNDSEVLLESAQLNCFFIQFWTEHITNFFDSINFPIHDKTNIFLLLHSAITLKGQMPLSIYRKLGTIELHVLTCVYNMEINFSSKGHCKA